MAKLRMVTSQLWEDEFFTALPLLDRLLWIGLVTVCADDQGRMQDSPAMIRSKVFPVDDIQLSVIDQALARFESESKIIRYQAGKHKCIQIANWWKHQTPRWAARSIYSPPEGWLDRERYHITKNEITETNWKEKGGFPNSYTDPYIDGYIDPCIDTHEGYASGGLRVRDVNVNDDVNDDVDVEEEGRKPAASPSPSNFPFDVDERRVSTILMNVTGNMFIPQPQADFALPIVHAIEGKVDDIADYLKTYWDAWRARGYSKTNYSWLEWAAAGEIPKGKNGKYEPVQQSTPEDLAEYAQEIIKARQEAK